MRTREHEQRPDANRHGTNKKRVQGCTSTEGVDASGLTRVESVIHRPSDEAHSTNGEGQSSHPAQDIDDSPMSCRRGGYIEHEIEPTDDDKNGADNSQRSSCQSLRGHTGGDQSNTA
jgi:hypothetical protein